MTTMHAFAALGLEPGLLTSLQKLGYETPSPIQAQGIPPLLAKRDLIAQAQTGSGKTATFALPIINNLNLALCQPQALVIAPTRELALQVAEAFQSYAQHLPNFHVLPIYGGQEYRRQLKPLKRGVHVVVGTPGRVMDHMRRGSLQLDQIKTVILDEADEMLKMGFIDDVEWILGQIPQQHQTGLFSATLPPRIKKIAHRYIHDAEIVHIKPNVRTVESIDQRYTLISDKHKVDALTRFLEVEEFDAVLIFVRTKVATIELETKLIARGYAAVALNGDMNQAAREKVLTQLKAGRVDIVIATEIAARGLDVERISLVINYDIPYDPESYVHRIGRTGRAGRSGRALMFVTPRERRMLNIIEQGIKRRLDAVEPPSAQQISHRRAEKFAELILKSLSNDQLDDYREFVQKLVHESEHTELDIAAALAHIVHRQKRQHLKEHKTLRLAPEELQRARPKKKKPFKGSKYKGRGENYAAPKKSRPRKERDRSRK